MVGGNQIRARNSVDESWTTLSMGGRVLLNPTTGEEFGQVRFSDEDDVDDAFSVAADA
jgi:hypothetical protein